MSSRTAATDTMRAVRFHGYGEPLDVLREEQVAVPAPPAGRIRVRVLAVGLNPADWALCRGFMAGDLPRGIGLDVAGTVDAIGQDVADVRVGDLVFGPPDFVGQPSAGVAGSAVLAHWFRVPDGLGVVEASVLTMPVQTAAWTLDAMGVGAGSTVVVHGAGGTVGFAAVQIARERGARVIATAGRTHASDLEAFGATVTSYGEGMVERVRAIASGPVDVLDAAPPDPGSLPALVEIAGDPARVVTISNHEQARSVGARSNLDVITDPTPLEVLVPPYAALAAEGGFRIPIARTFGFSAWRDAVALSLTGHARGKVVLVPDEATPTA